MNQEAIDVIITEIESDIISELNEHAKPIAIAEIGAIVQNTITSYMTAIAQGIDVQAIFKQFQ